MIFWDEKEAKRLFKKLAFYMHSIEQPYIKHLNNIDMLRELPFYFELSIVKTSKALKGLKGYARSYSIEIIDSKDSSVQLKITKPSTKDVFIKGFKYKITLVVLLSNCKENRDIEVVSV